MIHVASTLLSHLKVFELNLSLAECALDKCGIKDAADIINQGLLKLPSVTTRCYLVMTIPRLSH